MTVRILPWVYLLIADFDVRYATVVAAMAGVVVLIQHLLLDLLRWSAWTGGPRRSRDDTGGVRIALTLVILAILAAVAIVAPIAVKLVQLAISRQREYLADATSVKLTRNPIGLIHALQRLQHSDTAMARDSSPLSALCIAPPKRVFLRRPLRHASTDRGPYRAARGPRWQPGAAARSAGGSSRSLGLMSPTLA